MPRVRAGVLGCGARGWSAAWGGLCSLGWSEGWWAVAAAECELRVCSAARMMQGGVCYAWRLLLH